MACPTCPATLEARALLFGPDFWTYAWFAVLPFALTLLVVRWFVNTLDRDSAGE